MNLAELVEEFKEASGRIDLEDSEILTFLNRGSRLLDRRSFLENAEGRAHHSLNQGSFTFLTSPDLRTLKAVWAMTGSKRWQLADMSLEEARSYYADYPTLVEQGPVVKFCQTSVTLGPAGSGTDPFNQYLGAWSADLVLNNRSGYKGIIVWPIPDEATVIEVIGNYYTSSLQNLAGYDSNFWSNKSPQLLIQASLISLDANQRNVAGAKDLYAFIDEELKQMFYDDIEQEISIPSAMGGSEYALYRG